MWVYVNSCEFLDNKWCFNNKNVFTAIEVVYINGGSGQKPQNGHFKVFKPLISKHTKNLFKRF